MTLNHLRFFIVYDSIFVKSIEKSSNKTVLFSLSIMKSFILIVLLKERQTIGGYPKIGTVLNIDCFKLAQAKIGTKVRFQELSYENALEKSKKFYSSMLNNLSKTSFES